MGSWRGCSDDCSVQVDRGEAKQMKASQRSSITVRVWNSDGLVGITSTTDLSDSGLEQALNGAHQASAFGNPNDVPQFSPLATAPIQPLTVLFRNARAFFRCSRLCEKRKLSCWRVTTPFRLFPTTD